MSIYLFIIFLLMMTGLAAQNVAINDNGALPHSSAILDLQASDKGLLIPRLDGAQRDAIPEPASGLLVFQTGNDGGFYYYDGTSWRALDRHFPNSVTDTDGNVYSIVAIGTQQWLSRNLETTHFRNGDPIPFNHSSSQWSETTEAALAAYNDLPETYVPEFGLLYNGYAVNDPRGLCPEGWKVPCEDDWQVLINHLGDQAGGRMKSLSIWEVPNEGATNSTGFSALPAGRREADGTFGLIRFHAAFWSGWNAGKSEGEALVVKYNSPDVFFESRPAKQGLSVRCVKHAH